MSATSAQAQLSSSCTVSVLNRTARVRPDGSWVLPNVPASQGPVRVRANCVEGGVTRAGQSDFILVPLNGILQVDDISFAAVTPIPTRLSLSAPQTELQTVGQTVQLTARANLPDGSSVNVTGSSQGTSYRSSNPAIASVDSEGVVSAQASGTVLVSALNQGAIAVISIRVLVAGDSDSDGIPDDLELANGLDPNDPIDALLDPDQDGLSNRQELVDFGTDPRDADSDDDRASDGREVNDLGTNPLLFDTDGDLISDGLEDFAGSDPLDPQSVNLPPILAALSVDPSSFTVVFNTLLGEGSRQLTVTGTLIDGTRLNITGPPYGTTYESSNLDVASFGAEPGRVFAGAAGVAGVTARNGSFEDGAEVRVEIFSPQPLSVLPLPGSADAIALAGNLALVAAGGADLQLVDITDQAQPILLGGVSLPGDSFDVAYDGGFAYVAAGRGGLQVVDVRNPLAPVVAGAAAVPGLNSALSVAVANGKAYVADGKGLRIFDVAVPGLPILRGSLNLPGRPRGVTVVGNLAYIAAESAGLQVINVANAATPVMVGSTPTHGTYSNAADVAVRGDYAYVADGATTLGGVRVVDISVPSTPVVVGASADGFGLNNVALDKNYLFAADYYFPNAVPIFEISRPGPIFSSVLNFYAPPAFRDDNGHDVAVRDGSIFLVGDRWNVFRFSVTGNSALHIGRYVRLEEVNNVPKPPTVRLVAPAPGVQVRERRQLTLSADARDDVKVDRVRFLVNGEPVATVFAPPYLYSYRVPAGVGSLEIQAEAFDLAENRGVSDVVTVPVLPDNKPAIRMLTPVEGAVVRGGGYLEIAFQATDDLSVPSVEAFINGSSLGTRNGPPYRFFYNVPATGLTSLTVSGTATDGSSQTESTPTLTLTVDPDDAPVAVVLEPATPRAVPAGGLVRVVAGASDDNGLQFVSFRVDGVEVGQDGSPPFEHVIRVDEGATEVRLSVAAVDTLGQETVSDEVVLSVFTDPGTVAEGRVVDATEQPIEGAEVNCAGRLGTSDADGLFSIAAVPTLQGRIQCSARVLSGTGEELAGATRPVPPEPGGTTELGDLLVLPQLAYLSDGDPDGFGPPGRLVLFDPLQSRALSWGPAFLPAGLSGLAFAADGTLYASTLNLGGVIPSRGSASKAFGSDLPGNESRLLVLDPDTGERLEDRGRVMDALTDQPILLRELAYDPAAGRLYGLGSGAGSEAVYWIDPETAQATEVANGFFSRRIGLAVRPDGKLWVLEDFSEGSELSEVDPESGAVQSIGFVNAGRVNGMTLAPGGRKLRVVTGFGISELDPETGDYIDLADIFDGYTGELQAIAYRPLSAAPVTTTIRGRLLDGDGQPIADGEVIFLGASAISDADGVFELPDVQVPTNRLRVTALAQGELVVSEALEPVPGGITQVGDLTFGAPTCVSGRLLHATSCFRDPSPVTDVLTLEFQDDQTESWVPVGLVTPDADGRFCANLRRGLFYRLRDEAVECDCGLIATCETFLSVGDPNAHGLCSDAAPSCQEMGNIELQCNLFCGS
ncbi:MAG: Ig-like domain-containing protein [Thermoanaerobaculia bacterium]